MRRYGLVLVAVWCMCGCKDTRSLALQQEGSSSPKLAQIQLLTLQINQETYEIILYDSPAARELLTRLPMTISMNQLHDNEYYHQLAQPLPDQHEPVQQIQKGDFMLYGNDTLVFFYDAFSTTYSYTRLGSIADIDRMMEQLTKDEIEVTLL